MKLAAVAWGGEEVEEVEEGGGDACGYDFIVGLWGGREGW